ncbi:ATPase SWSAP1 [Scomber japonicus]|uniref:ATPase SWSAP1 n=1 Tax=Scomber japonicus TaxID=13676 RepID=UPI0023055C15|nr:ATPase SWSAP1 [Scomber japonicus]
MVMTDILAHVFRTFMSQSDQRRELDVPPLPPEACSTVLLVGERSTSRSVLLLAAVTAASQMGMRVMFFTQTQIQSLPVTLQKCVPSLSPESLKKIKFSYPRTVEELLQQVASLHESPNTSPIPPSLIIVDRLEGFLRAPAGDSHSGFHSGEQSCAAHLSALLCDTAAFLTQVLQQRASSSAPCRVIASFQSERDTGKESGGPSATDRILNVLDRYFKIRCTLDRDRSYEAAAAGLQEIWNIYLSGTGIRETSSTKNCDDKPHVAQEWQLFIFPDGLMEFKLI